MAAGAVAQQPARAPHPPPPTSLQPARAAQPRSAAQPQRPATGGTVMQFQKPADSVVPAHLRVPPLSAGTGLPEVALPDPGFAAAQKDDKKNPAAQPVQKDMTTPEQIAKYTKMETRERIFSIPNDELLERYVLMRILEDNPQLKPGAEGLKFPPNPPVGDGKPYVAKTGSYPPMRAEYAPLYVVHRRLHFEERNSERYGWDLGIVQPFLLTANFYKDVFLWPQSLASGCAYGFWDTSAGKCLPGSPTPYMLYPPGLTITGSVAETVIITGAAFAIP
jgi:hypothetical protein